ncbi:hypothetical protein FE257_006151 [Aspergillus nanangensis]|uniref:Bud22 domain-containing protein n=1 Tax=Aspergillus nanangensis TaxID=2582783 RepID=A0AAD4CPB9_ASPNN|nr:hypothetical protein FE257_006151 [Aspergillus nanangensis]
MPKRKLSDLDGGPPQKDLRLTRFAHKFDQGVILISRALKIARGFERQKLGRREKTAKSQGGEDQRMTLLRLAEEVQVLKSLEPLTTAQNYLFKQLVKTKRVAEAPLFIQFRQKKKLSIEGAGSTAETNVLARLYKSNPVKNVFPDIMTELKRLVGVDGPPAGKTDKKEGKQPQPQPTNPIIKPERPVSDISDDEEEEEEDTPSQPNHDMEISDDEEESLGQFDSRLAPDSADEDEGDDTSLGGIDLRGRSAMSISRSASVESQSPPPKKQKVKTPAGPVTSTTFLPSLSMGGYFSGSESEPEDIDAAEAPKRKNRMGQQARRALWEKKYGAGANHVQKQAENERRDRNSGWDARRGAVESGDGRRGGRPGRNGADWRSQNRGERPVAAARSSKPEDNKPLHPSWQAAKAAKEAKTMAAFQGKKVVFD